MFGGSQYGKTQYMEIMKMLYKLFSRARKEGLMALEADSDNPAQSPCFPITRKRSEDHHVL